MKISRIKNLLAAPEPAVLNYITSTVSSIDADADGYPTTPDMSIVIRQMKKVGSNPAEQTNDLTFRVYTVKDGVKTRFGQNSLPSSFTFTASQASGKDCVRAELTDTEETLIASLEILVKRQGNKGDSTVTYEIAPSETVLHANSQGAIQTGDLTVEVWRVEANNRSKLNLAGTSKTDGYYYWIQYRRDGGTWYSCFSNNGTTATVPSTAVRLTQDLLEIRLVRGAVFHSFNEVVKVHPGIPVVWDGRAGERGKTGPSPYYAGVFYSTKEYTADDYQTPYVAFDYITTVTQQGQQITVVRTSYHMLVADSNRKNGVLVPPRPLQDAVGIWEEMESSFKYMIAEAIFSAFAKLGSAVFNGDWMFSQYGMTPIEFLQGDYNLLYQGFVVGDGEGVTVDMTTLAQVFTDTSDENYENWLVDNDVEVANPSDAAWEWDYWVTHGFSNEDELRRLAYLCYMGVLHSYTPEQLLHLSHGEGYTLFNPQNMNRFMPNIALDFLTGKSYLGDAYVRGTIAVPTLRITLDNYSRYAQTKEDTFDNTYEFVYIPKNVGMVQLEYAGLQNHLTRICMPEIDEDKVGTELMIINATSAPKVPASGATVKIVSGAADPRAVTFGDENKWLMCGIACNGLQKYVDHDNNNDYINTVGCLATYNLPPATMMRFMSVSVKGGVRGWVRIGETTF